MVWSKTDPNSGEKRYVKKIGNAVVLTNDSRGALEEIPEGWEAKVINGSLRIKRSR